MPDFHIVPCSCHGQMIWVRAMGALGDPNNQVSGVVTFASLQAVTNLHFAGSGPCIGQCRANHRTQSDTTPHYYFQLASAHD